jgi:hypothetical protein
MINHVPVTTDRSTGEQPVVFCQSAAAASSLAKDWLPRDEIRSDGAGTKGRTAPTADLCSAPADSRPRTTRPAHCRSNTETWASVQTPEVH